MIVVGTGGRDLDDIELARRALESFGVGDILVVGGATGADELMRKVWHHEKQLPYVVHPAPWDRTGKAAGPMRNMAMVKGLSLAPYADLPADVVVALPGGRGTRHCYTYAALMGVEVRQFE